MSVRRRAIAKRFEGLGAVQESGETNMLDYQTVRAVATCMGYPEAAL